MAPEVLCIAVLDNDASEMAVQQLVTRLLARPRRGFVELHLLHVSFLGGSGAHLRSQVGAFVLERFLVALQRLPSAYFRWHLDIILASTVPMLTFRHHRYSDRAVAQALCSKAKELDATELYMSRSRRSRLLAVRTVQRRVQQACTAQVQVLSGKRQQGRSLQSCFRLSLHDSDRDADELITPQSSKSLRWQREEPIVSGVI